MKQKLLILFALIMAACATVKPLDGGPRDTAAPVMDSTRTLPPNGSTQFRAKSIVIEFDEFINFVPDRNKITITPQILPFPEMYMRGKKLIIDLKGAQLDTATTYTIYFDQVINDFHEGNDSSYVYAFSTGREIDSLNITGVAYDVMSGAGMKDVIVALFDDTVTKILDKDPKFITRTSATGEFEFQFLGKGAYKMYAFTDQDKNRKYNMASEKIGFIPYVIEVNGESTPNMEIPMSTTKKQGNYILNWEYNDQLFVVTSEVFDYTITPTEPAIKLSTKNTLRPDSSVYLIDFDTLNSAKLVVTSNDFSDTLVITKPKPLPLSLDVKEKTIYESQIVLKTNQWVKAFDTSRIRLLQDSIPLEYSTEVNDQEPNQILLSSKALDSTGLFTVSIDSSGITDQFLNVNDSTGFTITRKKERPLGEIEIHLEKMTGPYIVQLWQGTVLKHVQYGSKNSYIFTNVEEGNYRVRLIFDKNGNKLWDPIVVDVPLEPELIIDFDQQIKVTNGWTSEVRWKLKTK